MSFIHRNGYPNIWDGTVSILKNTYELEPSFNISKNLAVVDMHEFNVVNNGQSALMITSKKIICNLSDIGLPQDEGLVIFNGFREIDIPSGKILFDWNSADFIPLNESSLSWNELLVKEGWDYL